MIAVHQQGEEAATDSDVAHPAILPGPALAGHRATVGRGRSERNHLERVGQVPRAVRPTTRYEADDREREEPARADAVLAAGERGRLLTAGLAAPQAAAGSAVRRTTSTTNLAPGLTLTKINTSEPMQIRVLTIDPAKAVTLDLATAGGTFGSYARPSTMGANRGALAAINGDFTVDGRPLHPFAEDGFLRSSGLQSGGAFAESKDETHSVPGRGDAAHGGHRRDDRRAVHADGRGTAAHPVPARSPRSPRWAARSSRPRPARARPGCCRPASCTGTPAKMGVYKDWAVDVMRCQSSPLSLGKGMVLSSTTHRHRRRRDRGHAATATRSGCRGTRAGRA